MRQQRYIQINQKQQGFTLLIVLAIMMVIALMVVATSQSTNTEMHISANSADNKYAFSLADQTLKKAEQDIIGILYKAGGRKIPPRDFYDVSKYPLVFTELLEDAPKKLMGKTGSAWYGGNAVFRNDCTDGLCAPSVNISGKQYGTDIAAWNRDKIFHYGNNNCNASGSTCNSIEVTGLADPANSEVSQNPRYIIEFLGLKKGINAQYRITARAWGRNINTVVTLQSYIEVSKSQ